MEAGLFCMDMKLFSKYIVEFCSVEDLHHGDNENKGDNAVERLEDEHIGNRQEGHFSYTIRIV